MGLGAHAGTERSERGGGSKVGSLVSFGDGEI